MTDVQVEVKFSRQWGSLNAGERALYDGRTAAFLVQHGIASYVELPPEQPAPNDGPPVEAKALEAPPVDKMINADDTEKKGFFGKKLKR